MKLTIIVDDKRVGVDGVFYDLVDFPALDPSIHAVQWYGEYGEIEYKTRFDGGKLVRPENLLITDISDYANFVSAWTVVHEEELMRFATPVDSPTPLLPSVEL